MNFIKRLLKVSDEIVESSFSLYGFIIKQLLCIIVAVAAFFIVDALEVEGSLSRAAGILGAYVVMNVILTIGGAESLFDNGGVCDSLGDMISSTFKGAIYLIILLVVGVLICVFIQEHVPALGNLPTVILYIICITAGICCPVRDFMMLHIYIKLNK